MSPKIVDKEKRKREILLAAFDLFVQKGYHKTTLGEIARKAGMGQGTLYYYFPAKDELFWGVYEQLMSDIEAWMHEQLSMFKTPSEQLEIVLRLLFEHFPDMDAFCFEQGPEQPAWTGMLVGFSRVFMEFWLQAERSDKRDDFYARMGRHHEMIRSKLQDLLEKAGCSSLLGLDTKEAAHVLMALHNGIGFQVHMGIVDKQSPLLAHIRHALYEELHNKENQADAH